MYNDMNYFTKTMRPYRSLHNYYALLVVQLAGDTAAHSDLSLSRQTDLDYHDIT